MSYKKFDDKDGFKTCHKCEIVFIKSKEFFYVSNANTDKLCCICKKCDNKLRTIRQKERKSHNIPRRCIVCNTFFYAALADMNKTKRKGREGGIFCSRKCQSSCLRGRCTIYKGYSWKGARRGINNPANKYSEEIIKKIKLSMQDGKRNIDISKEFNITQGYISHIRHKRAWASLEI